MVVNQNESQDRPQRGDSDDARQPRAIEDYRTLPRSMARSHWRTQADLLKRRAPHKLRDYMEVQVLKWLFHYIKSRFGRKHPLPDYRTYPEDDGIYPLRAGRQEDGTPRGEEVRVSLVGDWATGTVEADSVGRSIRRFDPHFTIHLADIYYVGAPFEVRENFFDLVEWPLGSVGSFALNGNHEMYARGVGYFRHLLPELGLTVNEGAPPVPQKTSFFCLENDYWRVIGLDTAYHSVGVPFFEKIIKPSHKLPDKQIAWLRNTLSLGQDDSRGIVLLSHHQYYSAFEGAHQRAGKQLQKFLSRPVLWFWGHEHRMAVYGKSAVKSGIEAYGRCIGHGGMPVEKIDESPEKRASDLGLVLFDHRVRGSLGVEPTAPYTTSVQPIEYGYNGFANLRFLNDELQVEYRDHTDALLLDERWRVDRATGELEGLGVEGHIDAEGLVQFSSDLSAAQA